MKASQVYIEKLLDYGVKIFRYRDGFLHQKVILVDHLFAAVGSANFDFRSMFINFEITVIAHEKQFVTDVEVMLIQDFVLSTEISRAEFLNIGFWKKISSRAANLLAPVL
jgi:cardiolipin synthase